MLNLLMPRPARVSLRATLSRAIAGTASRLADVAAEFRPSPVPKPATAVVEPAGLLAESELPPVEDIAAAASAYMRAAEQARAADRGKRAARKLLDRLPAGLYGAWRVEREPSGRSTVDLEAVRATYKRLGLGDVPMKSAAPTLKVAKVLQAAPVDGEFAALAAPVLAGVAS